MKAYERELTLNSLSRILTLHEYHNSSMLLGSPINICEETLIILPQHQIRPIPSLRSLNQITEFDEHIGGEVDFLFILIFSKTKSQLTSPQSIGC